MQRWEEERHILKKKNIIVTRAKKTQDLGRSKRRIKPAKLKKKRGRFTWPQGNTIPSTNAKAAQESPQLVCVVNQKPEAQKAAALKPHFFSEIRLGVRF